MDHTVVRLHDFLYSNYKYPVVLITIALYAGIILIWGDFFEISSNYFVILPLIVVTLGFGMKGGIIGGALGLPANLLLFYLIGHMEYAPASLVIAEIFGLVVGTILGYLSDFFSAMKEEMRRRKESETALSKSLREKEILLREVNHRVKNNLNMIKSLMQLQASRAVSEESRELLIKLRDRILAIALVQDLLYAQDSVEILDLNNYVKELLNNLVKGFHSPKPDLVIKTSKDPILLEGRIITSVGIISNEIVTNITKYARPDHGKIRIEVEIWNEDETIHLRYRDNGQGYPDLEENQGLGFKMIRSMVHGIHGEMELINDKGGVITIHFPLFQL